MIQSFRVELHFHHPLNPAPQQPPGAATADLNKQTVLKLSHYCGQLHRLVAKLRLRQRPISHFQVTIRFSNTHASNCWTSGQFFSLVEALLNPFRRLCQIASPEVLSITMNNFQKRKMDILFPGRMSTSARRHYDKYLKLWSNDLSGPQASFRFVQALEAYWRLANLMSNIKDHYSAEPKFDQFTELIMAAKVARDDGSVESLGKVWDQVAALWSEYLDDQEACQSKIAHSISTLWARPENSF
jgi:hypothetical protein